MTKNWIGNNSTPFKIIGASNHVKEDREPNDYYATDPLAGKLLLQYEDLQNILEPACGEGHLSKVFLEKNIKVHSSDLIDRGFGTQKDFFEYNFWDGDIVTNPPYKYALEFVKKSLDIVPNGRKVAMFLKLTFLEGKSRKQFFLENPPKKVYVSSSRIKCYKNGENDFKNSAIAYAWYVWVKGIKEQTKIQWIN